MVDVSEIYESNWVSAELLKTMGQRQAVILSEGTLQAGYGGEGKQLVVPVELNGKQYSWGVNKTSYENIEPKWGRDSKNWVGKVITFTVMKISGKEAVIAIPAEDYVSAGEPKVVTETIKTVPIGQQKQDELPKL